MNAVMIQERVYAGYAKLANHAGLDYDHYRAYTPLDPISSGYQIGTIKMALSTRTRPFEVPSQYKDAVWLCWADGRLLQPRDFLVGDFGTFYIADMQPNLPIQAVKCNHVVTIERITFLSDNTESREVLASGLPVFWQLARVDNKTPSFGSLAASQAISHWTAFISMEQSSLKQHDIITDEDGVQYEIDAPDYTEIGYVANIRLVTG